MGRVLGWGLPDAAILAAPYDTERSKAATLRAYDVEARKAAIVARFLADSDFRLKCHTVRLSRRRLRITPPGGGRPIVWNREAAAAPGRPVGRPRKLREVTDVASETLVVGLAGLAKELVDKRGLSRPAAARVVVNRLVWQRRLDPSERDAVISRLTRVLRQLGYRRQSKA